MCFRYIFVAQVIATAARIVTQIRMMSLGVSMA